jgi:hypothetical protein
MKLLSGGFDPCSYIDRRYIYCWKSARPSANKPQSRDLFLGGSRSLSKMIFNSSPRQTPRRAPRCQQPQATSRSDSTLQLFHSETPFSASLPVSSASPDSHRAVWCAKVPGLQNSSSILIMLECIKLFLRSPKTTSSAVITSNIWKVALARATCHRHHHPVSPLLADSHTIHPVPQFLASLLVTSTSTLGHPRSMSTSIA